jgi:hypothetical protein
MKIVILGSAVPIRFGTPRQRFAHTLRLALTDFADVTVITVDAWKTEWAARHMVRQGDGFFGHVAGRTLAAGAGFLSWPAIGQVRPLENLVQQDTAMLHQQLQSGWMNANRKKRIAALLIQEAPDLLIAADPALHGLAEELNLSGTTVVCLDDGTAAWAGHMALQVTNCDESQWFNRLNMSLSAARRQSLTTHQISLHHTDADRNSLILPIEQEESAHFLAKTPNIVVPSTGNAWLDRTTLAHLKTYQSLVSEYAFQNKEEQPRLALIGFDGAEARAGFHESEIQHGWARLHTMIGIARILFLPVLTPGLLPLVRAALSVGTPVLTCSADARHFELGERIGLFTATSENLPAALVQTASARLATVTYTRAISEEARHYQESELGRRSHVAELLADWSGREALACGDVPLPPRRRLPIREAPAVLYNPITGMLMVQAGISGWGELEELRLLDALGQELIRLAPNANQRRQIRYVLEGGIVTDLDSLGGGIRIEGYCDVEQLFAFDIRVELFQIVECGVVSVEIEQNDIRGTLWTSRATPEALWSAHVASEKVSVSNAGLHEVPALSIDVREFRVPIPPTSGTIRLDISKYDRTTRRSSVPPQISLRIPASAASRRRSNAELARLKDCHKGKRAWIVGNGPSVRLEDLGRIPKGDIVFGFNRFYLSYDENPLREDYVVSADTLMVKDFGQEMIDIAAGQPLFCIAASEVAQLSGDFVLVAPGASSVPDFSFTPERYVSVGGSSVYVALQMAWHMGIRDLTLYGMDYSFTAKLVRDPRYPFPVSYDEGNHFIKSYRNAKPWCPPNWRDISAAFLNARIAYEMTGGRVVNATRGGRLEIFDRVDFDTLI